MIHQLRRCRLLAFLFVLLTLELHAQTATQEISAPATAKTRRFLMWKVTSPTATAYLVGSFHILKKDAYPLPEQVEAAFAASKALVVEVNMKALDQAKLVATMQEAGMYTGDDSLTKHISSRTSAALDNFCRDYGVPRDNFERMKPWLVSTVIAVLPLMKAGADPQGGIDMHFMNAVKAPQRIEELETMEFQTQMLSSGTEQEQDETLAYALKKAGETVTETAYYAGDTDTILKSLSETEPKSFTKRLIDERNPRMAEKIESYLKGRETVFVVVGLGHVIGDTGIAKTLERKSYKVEPMAFEW